VLLSRREFSRPLQEKLHRYRPKVRSFCASFRFDPRAAAQSCWPVVRRNQFFPIGRCAVPATTDLGHSAWMRAKALLQIGPFGGFLHRTPLRACLTNQKLLERWNAVRTKAANEFGVAIHANLHHQRQAVSGGICRLKSCRRSFDPLPFKRGPPHPTPLRFVSRWIDCCLLLPWYDVDGMRVTGSSGHGKFTKLRGSGSRSLSNRPNLLIRGRA